MRATNVSFIMGTFVFIQIEGVKGIRCVIHVGGNNAEASVTNTNNK